MATAHRRVVLFSHSAGGGGAEKVVLAWRTALLDLGYEVTLVLTNKGHAEVAPEGTAYIDTRLLRILSAVRELRLISSGADVVLSAMPYWNLINLLAGQGGSERRPRVIISEHNLHGPLLRTMGLGFRLQTWLARLLYRRSDGLIAVSHAVGAEMTRAYNVPLSRTWVLQNAVLESYAPITGRRVETASRSASVNVLFVGRLSQQKRPGLVIEAVAELTKRGIAAVAHFVGDGPLASDLRAKASQFGVSAVFHGWKTDWTAVAPRESVLLLPSVVEGFGNVLVEAAAAGIPSVATSRALGVAEACIDGLTGILTDEDSATAFAQGVLDARDLDPLTAGAWIERHTIRRIAPRLDRIISSTLDHT